MTEQTDPQPTQLETVSFRIPATLKRWLATEARRRAVTKTDVVLTALDRERKASEVVTESEAA